MKLAATLFGSQVGARREDNPRWDGTTIKPYSNSGTCLIHGSFVGSACPTCVSGGKIPTQQRGGG